MRIAHKRTFYATVNYAARRHEESESAYQAIENAYDDWQSLELIRASSLPLAYGYDHPEQRLLIALMRVEATARNTADSSFLVDLVNVALLHIKH